MNNTQAPITLPTPKVINFPSDSICPICRTNKTRSCVLLPIDGSVTDGGKGEGQPIHIKCLKLTNFRFNRENGLIYLKLYTAQEYADAQETADKGNL